MKVEYMTHSGSDLLVTNAARTSFSKESKEFNEKDEKLIRFLAREGHWLPFRHPSLTLRCSAPLPVARQLGKHQVGFSWSEESRRYIDTDPEIYFPVWREQAKDKKQGSAGRLEYSAYPDANKVFTEAMNKCLESYAALLALGVAREQARFVLPQATEVTWVWTGTLLAWANMLKARLAEDTQQETREFCYPIKAILKEHFPVSTSALLGD